MSRISLSHREDYERLFRAGVACATLSRRPCDRSSEPDYQQCRRATPVLAAAPVSCEALLADSSTALPAPLRFLPLHSPADASTDLSTACAPTDIASDYLEVPAPPVQQCEAKPASSAHVVNTWSQVLGVTAEPTSISLDDIREAQSLDDNLQPVIQALTEGARPPQGSLRDYPEEARALFSQWNSLVLEAGVLYRRYHCPDGTTLYLQVVLPVKLRQPYVERLHADLGHFGRTKTCMSLAR